MDRPVINERLIASYEIDFGKGKTKVCEYSPSLTKDEIELNQMTVKIFLQRRLVGMKIRLDFSKGFVYIDVELSVIGKEEFL